MERYKTLKEGAGAVVTIDSGRVDPSHEGRLVHLTGFARTEDQPADREFGVSVHALKLIREVEMYQWQEGKSSETQKKFGGGTETVTTYNYSKEWSSKFNDSADFKKSAGHVNPSMKFKTATFYAKPVTLDAFTLSNRQVRMVGGDESFSLPEGYETPEHLGEVTVSPTTLYLGEDPAVPTVGDLRVSFSIVPEQEVTLVAAQVRESFEPYPTDAGGTINLLKSGVFSSGAMIQQAQDSNKIMTWVLRSIGLLLMFSGFSLVMAPLSVLADVVPIIGDFVGMGTSILAFLLTIVGGTITIAVAWIVFRPVLAICLLAVTVAAIYFIFKKMKSSPAQA